MDHLRSSDGRLSNRQVVVWSVVATIVVEAITVVLRFGFEMEASRNTASVMAGLTGGIRIHHGYVGVVAMLVARACLERWPRASRWLLVAGIGLFCSDIIHHFLVLWPIVGSPEFDLVYPSF